MELNGFSDDGVVGQDRVNESMCGFRVGWWFEGLWVEVFWEFCGWGWHGVGLEGRWRADR